MAVPTINLTDNFGLNLDLSPDITSGISKYFINEIKLRFKDFNLGQVRNTPVNALPDGPSSFGLTVSEPVDIGITNAQLQIGGGASATLAVLLERDNDALQSDVFGDPLVVAANQAYVSLGLTATASPGLSTTQNDLSFGFNAGTAISITNCRPFNLAKPPALLSAIQETLVNFAIPGDFKDLGGISPGTTCTIEGKGTLKFTGNFELDFLTNPLATASIPLTATPIQVSAGGSVTVGAAVTIIGEYQIRVTKRDASTVRLGVHRKRAEQLDISVTPSVGVSATLGTTDLVEKVIGAVSKDPVVDAKALQSAGLDGALIAAINFAVTSGVQRRLEVAVRAGLTTGEEHTAAFLFDIALSSMNEASRAAVHAALDGDFSAITAEGLAGITTVRSIHREVTKKRHSLSVNLLGIFNLVSVSQLILAGKVLFEPETGNLVITDQASASRVQATSLTAQADPDKLRTLYAESFMITAAYRGSKTVISDPALTSAHSLFVSHQSTNHQTMKDMLGVPVALGLLEASDAGRLLDHNDDFGSTSLFAENRYDEALCKLLFLNGAQARPQEEYERAGRAALARIVESGDADEFRRILALHDDVWNQLKKIGNVNGFAGVLPGMSRTQVAVIGADYVLLIWWAESMSKMAKVLEQCEAFFAAYPNVDPGDHQFLALRQKLAKAVAEVVSNTKPAFGQPWGLIAMDQVLFPRSKARVQVTGKMFSLALERSATLSQKPANRASVAASATPNRSPNSGSGA